MSYQEETQDTIKMRLEYLRDKVGKKTFKEKLIGNNPGQVSRQTYDHWIKTGDRQPHAENIIQICKMFNVSANWLLGFDAIERQSPDPNLHDAAEYIGLSEKCTEALHYMKTAPYGSQAHEQASKSLNFIDRALKIYFEDVDEECSDIDFLRDNYYHKTPTVFSFLEDWVTGSGDSGEITLSNGRMRADEAFRMIAESEAKRMLLKYAEYDETFANTEAEYERLKEENPEARRKEIYDRRLKEKLKRIQDEDKEG